MIVVLGDGIEPTDRRLWRPPPTFISPRGGATVPPPVGAGIQAGEQTLLGIEAGEQTAE